MMQIEMEEGTRGQAFLPKKSVALPEESKGAKGAKKKAAPAVQKVEG